MNILMILPNHDTATHRLLAHKLLEILLTSRGKATQIVLVDRMDILHTVEEYESNKLMRFLNMCKEDTNDMLLQLVAARQEIDGMDISSVTTQNLPYFRKNGPHQQQSKSKPKATRRGTHFHRQGRR